MTLQQKFLFVPAPELGHLLPLIPSAQRLQELGHIVFFFVPVELGAVLDREGLIWIPYREGGRSDGCNASRSGHLIWHEAWADRPSNIDVPHAFLMRLSAEIDLRTFSMCVLDKLLSKKPAGLYSAISNLCPTLIVSTAFLYAEVDIDLNIPSTLVLGPRSMLTPDISRRFDAVTYCQYSLSLSLGEADFDWQKIDNVNPIILCTFGTQAAGDPLVISRIALLLEVATLRPDLIFVIGFSGKVGETLQRTLLSCPNVILERLLPQVALLKRSRIFITHAGLGGVKDAIALGVPMLCWPLRGDQWHNTECVLYHGLGISVGSEDPTAAIIAGQLATLLTDRTIRDRLLEFEDARQKDDKSRSVHSMLLEACSAKRSSSDAASTIDLAL